MTARSRECQSTDYYIASVAADLVPCSVHTLRAYVREGKLSPARTVGVGTQAISLFTDGDIATARQLLGREVPRANGRSR